MKPTRVEQQKQKRSEMSEETKEVGRMKDRLRKLLSRQNMSESELKAFNLKRAQAERERTQSQLAAMTEPERQAYYEDLAKIKRERTQSQLAAMTEPESSYSHLRISLFSFNIFIYNMVILLLL